MTILYMILGLFIIGGLEPDSFIPGVIVYIAGAVLVYFVEILFGRADV